MQSQLKINYYLNGKLYSSKSNTLDIFSVLPAASSLKNPEAPEGTIDSSKGNLSESTDGGKTFHVISSSMYFQEEFGDYPSIQDLYKTYVLAHSYDGKLSNKFENKTYEMNLFFNGDDKQLLKKVTGNLTIKTNKGDKVVKNISGRVGDKLSIKVPTVENFHPDKEKVTAVINEDGTITTDDTVEYIANEVTKPTPEPQKPTNPKPTPEPQKPGDSHHVSKPSKPGTSSHSVTKPTQKPVKPSINVV